MDRFRGIGQRVRDSLGTNGRMGPDTTNPAARRNSRNEFADIVGKVMKKKTPLQKKVEEATSNQNWGVPNSQLQEIAEATAHDEDAHYIIEEIWKGLQEKKCKFWRRIFKSLTLLESIILYGPEHVTGRVGDRLFAVTQLQNFSYMEEGKDKGAGIREKAIHISRLVKERSYYQENRATARENRRKMLGLPKERFDDGFTASAFNSGFGSAFGGGGFSSGFSFGKTEKPQGFGSTSSPTTKSQFSGFPPNSYSSQSKYEDAEESAQDRLRRRFGRPTTSENERARAERSSTKNEGRADTSEEPDDRSKKKDKKKNKFDFGDAVFGAMKKDAEKKKSKKKKKSRTPSPSSGDTSSSSSTDDNGFSQSAAFGGFPPQSNSYGGFPPQQPQYPQQNAYAGYGSYGSPPGTQYPGYPQQQQPAYPGYPQPQPQAHAQPQVPAGWPQQPQYAQPQYGQPQAYPQAPAGWPAPQQAPQQPVGYGWGSPPATMPQQPYAGQAPYSSPYGSGNGVPNPYMNNANNPFNA